MTPEQKAALEWLDWLSTIDGEFKSVRGRHARTLKAMLAEPRMPAEREGDKAYEDALQAIRDSQPDRRNINAFVVYRALRSHLSQPRTREIEVWYLQFHADISGGPCVSGPYFSKGGATEAAGTLGPNYSCIKITGPHLQSIPEGERE